MMMMNCYLHVSVVSSIETLLPRVPPPPPSPALQSHPSYLSNQSHPAPHHHHPLIWGILKYDHLIIHRQGSVNPEVAKCICPNYKRYLSKLINVFVQIVFVLPLQGSVNPAR